MKRWCVEKKLGNKVSRRCEPENTVKAISKLQDQGAVSRSLKWERCREFVDSSLMMRPRGQRQ